MADRASIARQAAAGLRAFKKRIGAVPVTIGFDGFVDSIITVVDKRQDADRFVPVKTIDQLGRKIVAAAGMSSNYELVVKLQKLGGNGPIMGNAMLAAGFPVTYIGTLGQPQPHPVFADFAARAAVHSVLAPGLTDALEFSDGKLMLGKIEHLRGLTWRRLEEVIGAAELRRIIAGSAFIGMVNWTMLPRLGDIWKKMTPLLNAGSGRGGGRKRVFIDLADPEKRTVEDLRGALRLIGGFQKHADVTLGLNLKEALQVAAALGLAVGANAEAGIEPMARDIRAALKIDTVVVHPRKGAAGASLASGQVQSARFDGPFVAAPKLSTGAGDNFNAGFCLGQLAGLPVEQCLCVGTAASGYYVRRAASPGLDALARFCEKLPPAES